MTASLPANPFLSASRKTSTPAQLKRQASTVLPALVAEQHLQRLPALPAAHLSALRASPLPAVSNVTGTVLSTPYAPLHKAAGAGKAIRAVSLPAPVAHSLRLTAL